MSIPIRHPGLCLLNIVLSCKHCTMKGSVHLHPRSLRSQRHSRETSFFSFCAIQTSNQLKSGIRLSSELMKIPVLASLTLLKHGSSSSNSTSELVLNLLLLNSHHHNNNNNSSNNNNNNNIPYQSHMRRVPSKHF